MPDDKITGVFLQESKYDAQRYSPSLMSIDTTPSNPAQAEGPTPLPSVRTLLLWLVCACLFPAVIGTLILFRHMYQGERLQLQQSTIQTTRSLVHLLDIQLLEAQSSAQTLSTSPYLVAQDFAGFHRQAREVLRQTGSGAAIVLTDRHGQQLVNTRIPYGAPLPRHGNPEQIQRVFTTGQPIISNVFLGGVTKTPLISVDVPVQFNDKVVYNLGISISTGQLNQILHNQRLPQDWVAAIFDRTGTIAARTHAAEQFVGKTGIPSLIRRLQATPEGVVEASTREGIPALIMFSRSPFSNWSVAIAIPRRSLESDLVRTVSLLGLGIAILFGGGVWMAWFMGGRIASSVQALTTSALTPGAGDAGPVSRIYFHEADAVARTMARTTQQLAQHAQTLQETMDQLGERETELAEAQRIAHFGSWYWDAKTGASVASEEWRRIVGRDRMPAFAQQRETIYARDVWQKLDAAMRAALETGIGYDMEVPALRADGTPIWLATRGEAVRSGDGQIIGLRGTVQDITAHKQAQEAQRWSAMLFTHIQDGAIVTDLHGTILAVNPAFTAINGYAEAEMVGKNMRILQSGQQDATFYQQMWQTILASGGWQGELWNRRRNGEMYLERLTIHAVYNQAGQVSNYVATCADLTQLKHADEMTHLAYHDVLTGLPNRLQLHSRMEHALEVGRRQYNLGAILFIDLDGFKAVNDTWGHPAGDDLLQQVARRLAGRMRDMDTLARLGGDEFVAVLENIEGPDSAANVAGVFVQLLNQPFILAGGQEACIGGSVGIAMFPTDGDNADLLLRRADAALYRAKEAGRNTYHFHTS